MKVAIRVDASQKIGTGHVMRCLSLAEGIKKVGGDVVFVCRELQGNLCNHIVDLGFMVLKIKESKKIHFLKEGYNLPHAAWLEDTWQNDVEQTISLIKPLAPFDWLIVDHYSLDKRWELAVRTISKKIMAIDDLFDRNHEADIILNQNDWHQGKSKYKGKVPASCQKLLGPYFALLHNSYRKFRDKTPPKDGKINRILVYFGGVDGANLTARTLKGLLLAKCNSTIDLVLPINSRHLDSIKSLANKLPYVNFYENIESLANLMALADLAIGASGTTSWERLCLGLPSLVITQSDNELNIAKTLQKQGLISWLGHHHEVSSEEISKEIMLFIKNGIDIRHSLKCRSTVDGLGVDRVVVSMQLNLDKKIVARNVTLNDEICFSQLSIPEFSKKMSFVNWLNTLDINRFYIVEAEDCLVLGAVFCIWTNGSWKLESQISFGASQCFSLNRIQETVIKKLRCDVVEVLNLEPKIKNKFKHLKIGLCSDKNSWINNFIPTWASQWYDEGHTIVWAHDHKLLSGTDLCFYLSYGEIVSSTYRELHNHNLVVHESNLPLGRGWSPITWQVLQGNNSIDVTLFEAAEDLDAGDIYAQTTIELSGYELIDEIRIQQKCATFNLCNNFIMDYPNSINKRRKQSGSSSYFKRRTQKDSQMNIDLPLYTQFNLLRVCDNDRYPAWFKIDKNCYQLAIKKIKKKDG